MSDKLLVVESQEEKKIPTKRDVPPLPDDFCLNIQSIQEAQEWLTNPHNWIDSELFILKFDGLMCKITRRHGERLARNPDDFGLAWCLLDEQKKRRARNAAIEAADEQDPAQEE